MERLQGQRLYVQDGIKVGKEGRKMPGGKRLHQESADVSKSEWIQGHYCSALAVLLGTQSAQQTGPIVFKLHDRIDAVEAESRALTLVNKMAALKSLFEPVQACIQITGCTVSWPIAGTISNSTAVAASIRNVQRA
ncbi:hypothetical protein [Leptodesmis sichuanensis]|uniref:hypothetical protein n=1 Tax=Leptodesmis sichuanensis TaxID=2906798 RepID=UPI001F24A03A|nr:hypothetical protein [Leptodesmis sichuanensis]UIE37755.1 hypothetical protein KIK02_23005 [Leptodesmis sichuanensis A121]